MGKEYGEVIKMWTLLARVILSNYMLSLSLIGPHKTESFLSVSGGVLCLVVVMTIRYSAIDWFVIAVRTLFIDEILSSDAIHYISGFYCAMMIYHTGNNALYWL